MRRGLQISVAAIGSLLIILLSVAVYLCVPRTPSASTSLEFEGFVDLPKRKFLDFTDYITVDGQDIFLTNANGGVIYKVNIPPGSPLTSAKVAELDGVPGAHGVAIEPVSRLAFATSAGSNAVDVFDPVSMRIIRRISVPPSPDAITNDPVDRLVYAPSGDSREGALIDPATMTVRSTIRIGGDTENAVYDAQSRRLYQNLSTQDAVAVIDVQKSAVVEKWPLARCSMPTGIAADGSDRRLFVVCAKSGRILVLDVRTGETVAEIPTGFGGDTVAYDRTLHMLYTTGLTGTLTVVRQETPDSYRVLDKVRLAFNAHTLAVNPVTHVLIVAYGGYGAAPRLAFFRPLTSSVR